MLSRVYWARPSFLCIFNYLYGTCLTTAPKLMCSPGSELLPTKSLGVSARGVCVLSLVTGYRHTVCHCMFATDNTLKCIWRKWYIYCTYIFTLFSSHFLFLKSWSVSASMIRPLLLPKGRYNNHTKWKPHLDFQLLNHNVHSRPELSHFLLQADDMPLPSFHISTQRGHTSVTPEMRKNPSMSKKVKWRSTTNVNFKENTGSNCEV